MKQLCYLISILLVSLAITGCPSDNSGNKIQRDFHIENHYVRPEYIKCWYYLDEPMPLASEMPEYKEIVETLELIYPGHAYGLQVTYFNDQEETNRVSWIQFETFVDGQRYSAGGMVVPDDGGTGPKISKGPFANINLFHYVPYDLVGKTVTVDVWLEDESGVASEVYTFELYVQHRWIIYPTTE